MSHPQPLATLFCCSLSLINCSMPYHRSPRDCHQEFGDILEPLLHQRIFFSRRTLGSLFSPEMHLSNNSSGIGPMFVSWCILTINWCPLSFIMWVCLLLPGSFYFLTMSNSWRMCIIPSGWWRCTAMNEREFHRAQQTVHFPLKARSNWLFLSWEGQ